MTRRGFLKTMAVALFAGPALLASRRPPQHIPATVYEKLCEYTDTMVKHQPLIIRPDCLICSRAQRFAARRLLDSMYQTDTHHTDEIAIAV